MRSCREGAVERGELSGGKSREKTSSVVVVKGAAGIGSCRVKGEAVRRSCREGGQLRDYRSAVGSRESFCRAVGKLSRGKELSREQLGGGE